MSRQYILALDQGTTSSRAIVFDHQGTMIAVAQKEFSQYFPQAGWVEHDAEEIWKSQLAVARSVLRKAKLKPADIAGIGITNQRETTVVWDRQTGKPIHPAIVWQDRRTAGLCDGLKKPAIEKQIRRKTGLIPDAYFSGTKIQWLLDHVKGARKKAEAGRLAFGTIDSWLIWNLTNGQSHVTDPSNACRTMLFDIHKEAWDGKLCERLKVPMSMLPTVCSSSEVYAETRLLGGKIPIAGIAGDQQAALFGQCCHKPGMVKNTYGTGCFMLMNTGNQPVTSQHNLLTSIAWKIGDETTYALEGSIFVAGAVVQWLRDGLGLFKTSAEVEALAAEVIDPGGVYVVPAFSGLGAPHWDQYARGTIVGMTRGTNKAHIARAALDGIAYQVADVLHAMQLDSGLKLKQLRVDGGASMNALLMQFQADLLRVPVVRPLVSETTALGAAYLAGLAVGFWKNQKEIATQWQRQAEFKATMKKPVRDQKMTEWQRALQRSMDWIIPD